MAILHPALLHLITEEGGQYIWQQQHQMTVTAGTRVASSHVTVLHAENMAGKKCLLVQPTKSIMLAMNP
jgi:hypothetical protein